MNRTFGALAALILGGGWIRLNSLGGLQAKNPLSALLPASSSGWAAAAPDKGFEGDEIFDYIDGAGEVYRAYNFRTVVARTYKQAGKPDLTVDLFDMGSSRDAFGVFTHDLEGEAWPVGQDSRYKSGLLQFWRDRYFVAVSADAETGETKAAVADLGAKIAAAIGRDGERPELLSRLPEDFKPAAVRYLHSPVILNYHFFVSRENILDLGPDAEAVLASGGPAAGKRVLLLVRYPTPAAAEKAEGGFLSAYMPEARPAGSPPVGRIVRTEDGLWTAAARQGAMVAIVFDSATEAEARSSLAAALSRMIPTR
jgi:hypothetical protein